MKRYTMKVSIQFGNGHPFEGIEFVRYAEKVELLKIGGFRFPKLHIVYANSPEEAYFNMRDVVDYKVENAVWDDGKED